MLSAVGPMCKLRVLLLCVWLKFVFCSYKYHAQLLRPMVYIMVWLKFVPCVSFIVELFMLCIRVARALIARGALGDIICVVIMVANYVLGLRVTRVCPV